MPGDSIFLIRPDDTPTLTSAGTSLQARCVKELFDQSVDLAGRLELVDPTTSGNCQQSPPKSSLRQFCRHRQLRSNRSYRNILYRCKTKHRAFLWPTARDASAGDAIRSTLPARKYLPRRVSQDLASALRFGRLRAASPEDVPREPCPHERSLRPLPQMP